ncbi:MAG: hypothetical protein OEY91_02010 [Nitrospirota bacterium]|jgi:hypothetical protein|nr:hypothetical protein [Nitrospirota bacterium]
MSSDLKQQVQTLTEQMQSFHHALEAKAREIEMSGGDQEVVGKLINGTDAMKDSANIYLSWARHYVNLSDGGASEAEEGEEDSQDFQF